MQEKFTVGWREWVSLPDLDIPAIKAKIDTGARTCALHAYYVEPYMEGDEAWVKFGIHPNQNDLDTIVECKAPQAEQRQVTDSGGHVEQRFVILTTLKMGEESFETEVTLTNRDTMRFRMLIGRNALNGRYLVDPEASYQLGKLKPMGPMTEENEDEDSDSLEE